VLPYAISRLQGAGYRLVTVAECLGLPPYQSVGSPQTPDVSILHQKCLSSHLNTNNFLLAELDVLNANPCSALVSWFSLFFWSLSGFSGLLTTILVDNFYLLISNSDDSQ